MTALETAPFKEDILLIAQRPYCCFRCYYTTAATANAIVIAAAAASLPAGLEINRSLQENITESLDRKLHFSSLLT